MSLALGVVAVLIVLGVAIMFYVVNQVFLLKKKFGYLEPFCYPTPPPILLLLCMFGIKKSDSSDAGVKNGLRAFFLLTLLCDYLK